MLGRRRPVTELRSGVADDITLQYQYVLVPLPFQTINKKFRQGVLRDTR